MEMEMMLIAVCVLCVMCVVGISVLRMVAMKQLNAELENPETIKLLELMNDIDDVPAAQGLPVIQAAYPGVKIQEVKGKKLEKNPARNIVWYRVNTRSGSIDMLHYNGASVSSR